MRFTLHIYRPTQQCFGISLQWRETEVLERMMTTLLRDCARTRKKKLKWTTLLIIDFGCSQEYLQCRCRVQRVLSLQMYQWHQTTLGSRYSWSTILHSLHQSQYEWWRWQDLTIDPKFGVLSCQACKHTKNYDSARATATTQTKSQLLCKYSTLG